MSASQSSFPVSPCRSSALNASHLQFEEEAPVAAGEVADTPQPSVVPAPVYSAAGFFLARRDSKMMRAMRVAKDADDGRARGEAGNRYASKLSFREKRNQRASTTPGRST
jgi:hypothetical protein